MLIDHAVKQNKDVVLEVRLGFAEAKDEVKAVEQKNSKKDLFKGLDADIGDTLGESESESDGSDEEDDEELIGGLLANEAETEDEVYETVQQELLIGTPELLPNGLICMRSTKGPNPKKVKQKVFEYVMNDDSLPQAEAKNAIPYLDTILGPSKKKYAVNVPFGMHKMALCALPEEGVNQAHIGYTSKYEVPSYCTTIYCYRNLTTDTYRWVFKKSMINGVRSMLRQFAELKIQQKILSASQVNYVGA